MPPPCVTLRLVLFSATWDSPLRGILRYAGFSAFRMQLIMPFKKNPLCKQLPVPPRVLLSATRDSRLRGILRYAGFSALRMQLIIPFKKKFLV